MDNPPFDQPSRIMRIKIMLPGGDTALGKALNSAIKTKDKRVRDAIGYMALGKKSTFTDNLVICS